MIRGFATVLVGVGAALATAPIRVATAPARVAASSATAVIRTVAAEFVGGNHSRRSWRGENHCWIEVRGLGADPEIAKAVLDAVRAEPGVRSAALNHPLSRVVVAAPEVLTLKRLRDVVAAAEARAGGSADAVPTDLPADGVVLAGKVIGAAATGVGLCLAVAGKASLFPALPTGLAGVAALVDYQPRLRGVLEKRLGATAVDTVLTIVGAAVYTATQAPASVAVEFFRHAAQIAECVAAAYAWQQREPILARRAECAGSGAPERPCPLPPGPVERHAERSALAQLAAASALGVVTANLNTAATAAVVAAPKAARNAREVFASTLGRGLANRHGVLPLQPSALRVLDRVDAVVVDPRVLQTGELRVSRIRDAAHLDRAEIWDWALGELDGRRLSAGWHALPERYDGATVFIRNAHHRMAAVLLEEVRGAGAEVVSVDSEALDELRSLFDELFEMDDSVDGALVDAVDALQRRGRTVAVVSSAAQQALSLSDVGIGITPREGTPPWHAGLLVDDLAGAWRVMHALPAARRVSERGVEYAIGASLLGALVMIPGVRGGGTGPVTAGAAAGIVTGFWQARGVLRAQTPAPAVTHDWHAMPSAKVREMLPQPIDDVPKGRSRVAVTAQASAGAIGQLIGPVRRLARELFTALRDELSDPLTPMLAIGSAASAALGSPVDALLVGSVLVGNSLLAATQQVRAERLLRRLLAVQDPPARRMLGGEYHTVEAARLRPGDLIEIRPGEVVPADARLVEVTEVEVDESTLTGESMPVSKRAEATPGAVLAERSCMVYATTTMVAGTALAVVTAVGADTQARRVAEMSRIEGSAVGLQTQLRDLTIRALPVSLAGGAVVTGLGLLRRVPLLGAVSSGVAVAVAAIPEGMPLVATLAQQASARRLTKSGVLVRSPRAVEALGRIDVVCFDKTGTLSENRLRVAEVHPAPWSSREQVLITAAQATPPKSGDHHEHATDAAVAAAASRVSNGVLHLPFRSGRPFSASVVGDELVIKGAPEVVLASCTRRDTDAERAVRAMAERGLRVIAVAHRALTPDEKNSAADDSDAFTDLCRSELEIVGLLGLSDTPRADAGNVLRALRDQQIAVRLITGDHPVTAMAIAAELGMPVGPEQVISGAEWDALPRRGQEEAVRERLVFARMTPENKVQIVQTVERAGQVCAMVGDGANDAAAIRAATIGIGVVSRGSDPARTAADVMLLDGRIGALLDALDEGRQLWLRVQAAVAILLGGNAGEVAFAIAGAALSGRSPLNTRQLLVVNFLTDALPAAALAVSPANTPANGGGHGPDQAALWRTVAIRGATTATAALAAWLIAGFTIRRRHASTVALIALVSTQLGQTLIDSHSPLVVSTAVGSLVALGTLISIPGVSQLLGCTPLGPLGWSQALGTAAVATAAAAVIPRFLGGGQPSTSSTPTRHNTAYSSRNGTESARVSTSVNGSTDIVRPDFDTPPTVEEASVETSNT